MSKLIIASFAAAALAASASAQETPQPTETAAPATEAAPVEAAPAEPNPDESADSLNAQQKLEQSYTLTRTVDGKVVETTQKKVVYSKDDPVRDTEAGLSPIERLKAELDAASLTRSEAVADTRLDFTIADKDRNGRVTADEYAGLVREWLNADDAGAAAATAEPVALLEAADTAPALDAAKAKFAAFAGTDPDVGKRGYTRFVIREFDAADADRNRVLEGAELAGFRAALRGTSVSQ